MAVGDIGSIISEQQIASGLDYLAKIPLPLGEDTEYYVTGGPDVSTWSCSKVNGGIAKIAEGDMATGYTPWSEIYCGPVFHVSGTVYGCFFITDASGWRTLRLATANINDNGNMGANIAVTTLETYATKYDHGYQFTKVLHISGTIYACVYVLYDNAPVYRHKLAVHTVSISNDGATVSNVDFAVYDWGNAYGVTTDFCHVSGNVYVAVGQKRTTGPITCISYNIADNGTITQIDTLDVDTDYSTGDVDIRLCKITSGVWALSYSLTSPSALGRIRIFALADNGTFGSVIDTDDTILTSLGDSLNFQTLGDNVFLATMGSYAYTFGVADDGIIGALVDSLNLTKANGTLYYIGTGNYFTGCYLQYGTNTWAFSVDIEQALSSAGRCRAIIIP